MFLARLNLQSSYYRFRNIHHFIIQFQGLVYKLNVSVLQFEMWLYHSYAMLAVIPSGIINNHTCKQKKKTHLRNKKKTSHMILYSYDN
jgi:hypothetical protein